MLIIELHGQCEMSAWHYMTLHVTCADFVFTAMDETDGTLLIGFHAEGQCLAVIYMHYKVVN